MSLRETHQWICCVGLFYFLTILIFLPKPNLDFNHWPCHDHSLSANTQLDIWICHLCVNTQRPCKNMHIDTGRYTHTHTYTYTSFHSLLPHSTFLRMLTVPHQCCPQEIILSNTYIFATTSFPPSTLEGLHSYYIPFFFLLSLHVSVTMLQVIFNRRPNTFVCPWGPTGFPTSFLPFFPFLTWSRIANLVPVPTSTLLSPTPGPLLLRSCWPGCPCSHQAS